MNNMSFSIRQNREEVLVPLLTSCVALSLLVIYKTCCRALGIALPMATGQALRLLEASPDSCPTAAHRRLAWSRHLTQQGQQSWGIWTRSFRKI